MVIRRRIVEQRPWVVLNLLKTFDEANEVADACRTAHVDYYLETGLLPAEAKEVLKAPLVRHGIRSNRLVLETAARFSYEQGLTPQMVRIEDVFSASTLER